MPLDYASSHARHIRPAQMSYARRVISNAIGNTNDGPGVLDRSIDKIEREIKRIDTQDYQDNLQDQLDNSFQDLMALKDELDTMIQSIGLGIQIDAGGGKKGIDARAHILAIFPESYPLLFEPNPGNPHAFENQAEARELLEQAQGEAVNSVALNLGDKYTNWKRKFTLHFNRHASLTDEGPKEDDNATCLQNSLKARKASLELYRSIFEQYRDATTTELEGLNSNGTIARIQSVCQAQILNDPFKDLRLKKINQPGNFPVPVGPANSFIDNINTNLKEYRRVDLLIQSGHEEDPQKKHRDFLKKQIQADLNSLNIYLNINFAALRLERLILPASAEDEDGFVATLKTLQKHFKPQTKTQLSPLESAAGVTSLNDIAGGNNIHFVIEHGRLKKVTTRSSPKANLIALARMLQKYGPAAGKSEGEIVNLLQNHVNIFPKDFHIQHRRSGWRILDFFAQTFHLGRDNAPSYNSDSSVLGNVWGFFKGLIGGIFKLNLALFGITSSTSSEKHILTKLTYYDSGNIAEIAFTSPELSAEYAKLRVQVQKELDEAHQEEAKLEGKARPSNPDNTVSYTIDPRTRPAPSAPPAAAAFSSPPHHHHSASTSSPQPLRGGNSSSTSNGARHQQRKRRSGPASWSTASQVNSGVTHGSRSRVNQGSPSTHRQFQTEMREPPRSRFMQHRQESKKAASLRTATSTSDVATRDNRYQQFRQTSRSSAQQQQHHPQHTTQTNDPSGRQDQPADHSDASVPGF